MRRITVEEVKAAYAKTGIVPDRNDCSRCAMAALIRAAGIPVDGPSSFGQKGREWVASHFSRPYRAGFINAFDGASPCTYSGAPEDQALYDQGYDDGEACAAAVFEAK